MFKIVNSAAVSLRTWTLFWSSFYSNPCRCFSVHVIFSVMAVCSCWDLGEACKLNTSIFCPRLYSFCYSIILNKCSGTDLTLAILVLLMVTMTLPPGFFKGLNPKRGKSWWRGNGSNIGVVSRGLKIPYLMFKQRFQTAPKRRFQIMGFKPPDPSFVSTLPQVTQSLICKPPNSRYFP